MLSPSTRIPMNGAGVHPVWRGAALCGAFVLFAACGPDVPTPPPSPTPQPPVSVVASVAVSPASASVNVGATVALAATVRDASGNEVAGKTVQWTSGNVAAATVSSSGTVTGLSAGTVTITAAVDGKSGAASVVVSAVVPGELRADASTVRAFGLVQLRPVGYTGILPDSIKGTLDNTEFRAIRISDTTLLAMVPNIAPGPHTATFVLGGRPFSVGLTTLAVATTSSPAAQAKLLFDGAADQLTAMESTLNRRRVVGLDTMQLRASIASGRAAISDARTQFNALAPDAQSVAYSVMVAQLQGLENAALAMSSPVGAASMRSRADLPSCQDPSTQFVTCIAFGTAAEGYAALAFKMRQCVSGTRRDAIAFALTGAAIGALVGGGPPGAALGALTGLVLAKRLRTPICNAEIADEGTEVFTKVVDVLQEEFEEPSSPVADPGGARMAAGAPFVVGVARPLVVRARLRSASANGASNVTTLVNPLGELQSSVSLWDALRREFPALGLPAFGPPSAPVVNVVKDVPGTFLRVGAITPSEVTASATGEIPWLVTFSNARQGDDIKNLAFSVQLAIPGVPPQSRPLQRVLQPARYTVRSLSVSPITETIRVREVKTITWTARDSSGDVLTEALLLGRRPSWTSADPKIATVVNCCGIVSGEAPGTTAITGRLEEGSTVQILEVLPDVTGTYTLKSLNGKSIPGETYSDSTYVINTTGGTLTLRADKTFSFGVGATGRNRSNGQTFNESSSGGGTYTVSGNTISFFVVPKTGENLISVGSASLVGDRLTVSFSARDSDGEVVSGVAVVER